MTATLSWLALIDRKEGLQRPATTTARRQVFANGRTKPSLQDALFVPHAMRSLAVSIRTYVSSKKGAGATVKTP